MAQIRKAGESKAGEVLALWNENCLLAHPAMEGRCGEIEEPYVQPHIRRHGIGSALVNQAVALLHEQGASPIRAHVCADSPAAKSFWQHMGWEHDLAVFSLYGE